LEILRARENLELSEIAQRCGVTYQSIKNVTEGGSPNGKFLMALVEKFGLRKEPELLRCLLVGFLRAQFDDREGTSLLKAAGLLDE
jgi:transcriptional regulator with XRE-family HTH domain